MFLLLRLKRYALNACFAHPHNVHQYGRVGFVHHPHSHRNRRKENAPPHYPENHPKQQNTNTPSDSHHGRLTAHRRIATSCVPVLIVQLFDSACCTYRSLHTLFSQVPRNTGKKQPLLINDLWQAPAKELNQSTYTIIFSPLYDDHSIISVQASGRRCTHQQQLTC